MELPRTTFSNAVDLLITRIGNAVSWIWAVLLGVIVINVFMRYALGELVPCGMNHGGPFVPTFTCGS